MRYIGFAVGLGLVGIVLAVVLVSAVGAGPGPFSSWWLVNGIIFPVCGVVYSPFLLQYLKPSRAQLLHTAEGAHWFPFVLAGTLLSALGYYACYMELASLNVGKSFWYLLTHPAEAPEITTWGSSQLGRIRQHSDAPLDSIVIGGPLGALGTFALIRQVWD